MPSDPPTAPSSQASPRSITSKRLSWVSKDLEANNCLHSEAEDTQDASESCSSTSWDLDHESPKTTKSVCFDLRQSQTFEIPHRLDTPRSARRQMWYSPTEYVLKLKLPRRIDLDALVAGLPETDYSTYCGLAHPSDACRRADATARSLQAVLTEQELQRQEGICDPDLLADVYADETYYNQKEAENRALSIFESI